MDAQLDVSEKIEGGDIVAIVNGKVTKPENLNSRNAALYMIVTDSAGVIGNGGCPPEVCVTVSFVGQVRTNVTGKVNEGDYILADDNFRNAITASGFPSTSRSKFTYPG